jgi:signal transduction histidine kinase
VTLHKDISESAAVVADRDRLMRAVQNLIDNSIQHSPPDSVVTIASRPEMRGKGRVIGIHVRDQGRGFAAEDLGRVFEPFFSRRRGGTGLGLALVQQIVTEHGGEVTASNNAGGGAEVTITIPAGR